MSRGLRIAHMSALLNLLGLISIAGPASAQSLSGPLAPPPGNLPFLKLHATGTQNYICLPTEGGADTGTWVFERPQAALSLPGSTDLPVDLAEHALLVVPGLTQAEGPACSEAGDAAHEYCPSWRSPLDQSTVWGTKVASETAGTAADCPPGGAIACLLLKAVATAGSRPYPGPGFFGSTTFVQRLNTIGGATPTTICQSGQIEQVPYSADYVFFRSR